MVKVHNGVIADRKYMLMRPPAGVDHFDQFNIGIHHIDPHTVARQPRWRDSLPAMMDFIGDDVVVAHNAGFDIGVIRYACAVDNIPWPEMRFACSLVLARKHLTLPSYRLPFVLEACGMTMDDHHNALADAEAVAVIVMRFAEQLGATSVDEIASRLHTTVGRMAAGVYHGAVATSGTSSNGHLIAADANPNADPNGYLYGRVVVFTGKLMAMVRQDAWNAVAAAGGRPEKGTTRSTNVLVLGDFNPANLRPGFTYSTKASKAFELQDQGQDIELMTEADFLQVLDGRVMLTDELAALIAGPEDPTGT
ncbi:exonuclease domain-containing protein [Flexivirga alba]|uniref:Exonuclease domain-containing protein n=1 Tax=Flexivirga alba TaxID=702742 RepID=A0ABW2AJD7_9MICO